MNEFHADPTETAISDITKERVRQIVAEHHLAQQDDRLVTGDLAQMAAVHAMRAVAAIHPAFSPLYSVASSRAHMLWPAKHGLMPYHGQRRHLVIAAALLVAEIERLDRAAARAAETQAVPDAEAAR